MAAVGEKRKAAEPVEDEAEKIRKKKEAAQLFFAEAKKKKDAAKLERQAAIARGEAPEKAAVQPLKEPPSLAPQVRAFTSAAMDPSVSDEGLFAVYQRLQSVRHEISAAAAELAKREDVTVQARRKALLRVLVDRLRCVEDQTMPVASLAADPAVAVLRKGLAKSLLAFMNNYPESLQVADRPNAKGNAVQSVTLVGNGPKGTGCESLDSSVNSELLLAQVLTTLQSMGGTATLNALGKSPWIRTGGMKLSKLLTSHPDLFELTEGAEGKEATCTLRDAGSLGFGA